MIESQWLPAYAKNIASQFGEDGILEKIFRIIPDGNKWCVEFGAWDGKLYSNTWNLITHSDWSAVLIESQKKKFQQLCQEYQCRDKVITLNRLVQFNSVQSLDNILRETPIPDDFDLLSIDIDGNDYHIWDSLQMYHPKVVVIEFNPSIPNEIEFIQKKDMKVNQGSSLLAINRLAKRKGYEMVCATTCNGIFVREDYFPVFSICDNSLAKMRPQSGAPQVFQLFDGTLVLSHRFQLSWLPAVEIDTMDFQVLPKFLRFYKDANFSRVKSLLRKIYCRLKFGHIRRA